MPVNIWNLTIKLADIWKWDGADFEAHVKEILKRVKDSGWSDITGDPDGFDFLFDALERAKTPEEFNPIWNDIYDLADDDRVWIETQ